MDKQREFWKHNINPITGFVYDSIRDTNCIKQNERNRLKRLGVVRRDVFMAEYIFTD